MAFTIKAENRRKGLVKLVVGIISILLLLFATYYLFFTSPPQIDVLVPLELEAISKISKFSVDPGAVIDSPQYKSLKKHVGPAELGEFGRVNPFARF